MKAIPANFFLFTILFGSYAWKTFAFEPPGAVAPIPKITSSTSISLPQPQPTGSLTLPDHKEYSKKLAYVDPKISYYMMIILLEKLVPEGNVIYMILEDPTLISHYCTALCDDPYNCPCPSTQELKDLDIQHVYMCAKRCQYLPHEVDTYLDGEYGKCWRNCISSFVEFIPPSPTTTRSYWTPATTTSRYLQSGLANIPTAAGKQDVEYTLGTPEDEEDFNMEPVPKEQKGATPEVGAFVPPAVKKLPMLGIDSNKTTIGDVPQHIAQTYYEETGLTLASGVIEDLPNNATATTSGSNYPTSPLGNITETLASQTPTRIGYSAGITTNSPEINQAVTGANSLPTTALLAFLVVLGALIF